MGAIALWEVQCKEDMAIPAKEQLMTWQIPYEYNYVTRFFFQMLGRLELTTSWTLFGGEVTHFCKRNVRLKEGKRRRQQHD